MKVLYTKNNNHFMFYSYNKFLVSILLYLLEKNLEATTVLNKRFEVDLNLHTKKKKKNQLVDEKKIIKSECHMLKLSFKYMASV